MKPRPTKSNAGSSRVWQRMNRHRFQRIELSSSVSVMASPFRFQGTAFALAALLLATRLVSAVESPADRLQLPPRQIAFDGWGTSLCWFANEIGRWPEPQRAAIADALFSKA